MMNWFKFFFSLLFVVVMCKFYYSRGLLDGEMGVNYWQGWHDAMMQTEFGKKPYNSEESLLR
jgi:hypothetical protein